jgi:hypothetical protein
LVPSDRVIVPRSLAFALPDPVTVLVVVTGGQAPAHAPVHADVPPVSLAHRYTARPEPLTRNVLPEDEAVVMTVADVLALPLAAAPLGAAAGELLAGALVLLLLLPLEHAATSAAAPIAPPTAAASLARAGTRLTMEFLIVRLLSSATQPRQARTLHNCRSRYGAKREQGLDTDG